LGQVFRAADGVFGPARPAFIPSAPAAASLTCRFAKPLSPWPQNRSLQKRRNSQLTQRARASVGSGIC